ncbi:MAG: DUF2088 domain-containing protein, partial [Chloroflexi bacterium]|nr:DUF2088 domain-containing protein [Chloroflexota bacterium]
MVEQALPYGDGTVQVELPDRTRIVGGGGPSRRSENGNAAVTPAADQAKDVRTAIEEPLGLPRIRDSVSSNARVLIAFDDLTVSSFGPVRRLAIEAVLAELSEAGVSEQQVTLICANALHRKWTTEELASAIGDDLVRRFGSRLICHDAEDAESIVNLGTTKSGYDVEIHRLVVESDLTVYVNAQCHMGFAGGWKSVAV